MYQSFLHFIQMDAKLDFVVKLGGSAVTIKTQNETVHMENIQKAANALLKSWQLGKKFVIVHGAGYANCAHIYLITTLLIKSIY